MKLTFLLFIIPFLGLIAGVSFFIFKAGVVFGLIRTPLSKQIMTWIFILMPTILIVTMTIGNFVYSKINSLLYVAAATWLPILIYFFIGALILFIVNLFMVGHNPLVLFPFAVAAVVISLGATAYGIVNATMPRVVEYTVELPALRDAWSGKNIVLISDTHLGVVRSSYFMKKVVGKINAQNPDLVLIAGDIIDGPVFDYAKGLTPLAGITSTFGTIYTPGNHEAYNREPEKFYPVVRNVTTTLMDSSTTVNNTEIIGLDYRVEDIAATKARLEKVRSSAATKMPSIALLHDPRNTDALFDAGIDLVVSGHTHCGQFFPMTLLVKSIYKEHTYGLVHNARGGASITTCGVGTAMSPLRLGTNPEVVVIHIK